MVFAAQPGENPIPQSESVTGIPQHDLRMPKVADLLQSPYLQTTGTEGPNFATHQQGYLDKHKDEIMPRLTGPFAVAVVSRAYRELANGNLTEQLVSFATQHIPPDQFRAYIAVNNVRAFALAADVWDKNQGELATLPTEQERISHVRDLAVAELAKRNGTKKDNYWLTYPYGISLEQGIHDYRENQATLRILESLTIAVNRLSTQPKDTHTHITDEALDDIRQSAKDFMTEAQIQTLLIASKAIMRKRIMVMGVDCSSFANAEIEINQGKATNEAAHIALAQGAAYIDVGDMDQSRGPDALVETYDLAQNGSPVDVLIRPSLIITTPQHPEQQEDTPNLWADLVTYYHDALVLGKTHDLLTKPKNSGTQIVSARAFRKHEYPEARWGESVKFADATGADRELIVRKARTSELFLAHRRREVSAYGNRESRHAADRPLSELRRLFAEEDRQSIKDLIEQNNAILQRLTPEGQEQYKAQRKFFFEREMDKRRKRRRLFLGVRDNGRIAPNGVLPALYRVWKEHPNWSADEIIESARLRPWYRAFLEPGQNPLLVKGVLKELQRIQAATRQGAGIQASEASKGMFRMFDRRIQPSILPLNFCITFIEQSLPELFGEPLTEEPSYDAQKPLSPDEINVRNWMQIREAIYSPLRSQNI